MLGPRPFPERLDPAGPPPSRIPIRSDTGLEDPRAARRTSQLRTGASSARLIPEPTSSWRAPQRPSWLVPPFATFLLHVPAAGGSPVRRPRGTDLQRRRRAEVV